MREPGTAKKARPEKPLLEPVSEDGNSSFARALGSVDYQTREKGLKALTSFLSRRSQIEALELKKLWKGLFYCFWHSDGALRQEELATRLAAILPQLSDQMALKYFEGFLEAMQREWFGIDRLRLDKFLMLVRKFLNQLFVYLNGQSWSGEAVEKYADLLQALLKASDEQPAAGLSSQIVDVTIAELLSVLHSSKAIIPNAAMQTILDVFMETASTTTRLSLLPRIREGVFKPLVEELQSPSDPNVLQDFNLVDAVERLMSTGGRPGVKSKARDMLYSVGVELDGLNNKKRKKPEPSSSPKHEQPSDGEAASGSPKDVSNLKPRQKQQKRKGLQPETVTQQGCFSGDAATMPAERATEPPQAEGEQVVSILSGEGFMPGATTGGVPALPGSEENGKAPKRKKKKKNPKALVVEAIERAAGRTQAAIEAHKKGKTTVHPATPGSPSQVQANNWFHDSLEAEKLNGAPQSVSPSTNGETPSDVKKKGKVSIRKVGATVGTQGKRVSFALKRNLYLDKGQEVPAISVRTPDSCRPKGSALKKFSKFSSAADDATPQPRPVSDPGNPKKRKSRLGINMPHAVRKLMRSA